MITLTSEKGLIHVESWDDIESRPGFVRDLDPTQHSLDAIIGRYIFKERIRCGLSNCHTPHAKGYIVVTKEGHETNIGKDCGKSYFGVDFETLSRRFDRDITAAENRDRLWNFSFRIDELESRIAAMRGGEKGADWIHRNIRPLMMLNEGCPDEVVRCFTNLIKSRSNSLKKVREASEEELRRMEAIEGKKPNRPSYVEEPIAEIRGVDALYAENDLRQLLIFDIEAKIKDFLSLSLNELQYDDLRHWVKWVDSVEPTLERAGDAVRQGRALLEKPNLQPLLQIITKKDGIEQFRGYLNRLSA